SSLFGLDNLIVKRELERIHKASLRCQVTEWNDLEIMKKFFYKHLYQNIATTNLSWYQFFVNWKTQKSNIIELTNALKKIYPSNFTVDDRILRNWRAMLRAVGCTNITPFSKQESKLEFWSSAIDPLPDKETIENLYKAGLLNLGLIIQSQKNEKSETSTELKFWRSFEQALDQNKRGLNGCSIIEKPVIKRSRISNIQDAQFLAFFDDKNNVSMSSYAVDKKTGLPLLYLKDNKEALWNKFKEKYSSGIKRNSFMARLANDERRRKAASKTLRRHLRKEFEKELTINNHGTTHHVECINHCLMYAF
ncbi:15571_t:CDS:2, partial [Acaulospora morrowiae]